MAETKMNMQGRPLRKATGYLIRGLLGLALLLGAWCLWVVHGHEARTWQRLVNAHVVDPAHHGRLLHSTGYWRENSHVFECPRSVLLPVEKDGVPFYPLDMANENHAAWLADGIRPLVDACVQPPLDWEHVQVWNAEGAGLLSQVFSIRAGDRHFVVLQVF